MNEDLWKKSGQSETPDSEQSAAASTSEPSETTNTSAAVKAGGTDKANMSNREWRLIEKLVMSLNSEQRKSRRWGIFFKSLTFAYLFVALFLFVPGGFWSGGDKLSGDHTALVSINGVIAESEKANANAIAGALRKAFEDEGTQAVILRINSPGGSPVQAGYIYDEIKRLRALHPDTKVYAVIADIGASGGYYIAAAADYIYADKASLVGSIGVISSSFGFVDLMEKVGVERRIYAAGENKAFLDPFSPQKEGEAAFWQGVLNTTHQQFIEQVKKGRGERLNESADLFNGLIWTGEQALDLGLIDGLGSAGYVAREVVGFEEIVDYSQKPSPFEQLIEDLGVSFGKSVASSVMNSGPQLR